MALLGSRAQPFDLAAQQHLVAERAVSKLSLHRHELRALCEAGGASVVCMVYRQDLIEHFEWLAGSEYFDEVIDEALVAIALTAYDHGGDLIQNGAWMTAHGVVERFCLEKFVERLQEERLL